MKTDAKKYSNSITEFIKKYNTYIMLAVCLIICMAISPDFLTLTNLFNISRQYAALTVVSMGMLLVIATGGIDLSVGSYLACGSVLVAIFINSGLGLIPAILLDVALGLVCGTLSGVLVAKFKMPAFIVTMAMMTIIRGAAFILSNGSPIRTPSNTISQLGQNTIAHIIPLLLVLALVVVAIFAFVINRTSFGRIVLAIGSNENCVRLSGIRVNYYLIAVYAISGLCATLGGVMAASRTGIGTPLYGEGLELDAIAACVIGGASLSGGTGSAVKTVVGVLVLALIGNIMNLLSVPSYPQDVIKGLIIIASVLLQIFTSSKKEAA
ncbi:MAG: ABC transporter permease [Clostridiales bacterium]|nr:ABC transporter permease [Clostridiales bacterium]